MREYVNVCLKDLSCPITVGSKSKLGGENTIINIRAEAEIERKYEKDFEKKVIETVNNRNAYIGPMQLSSNLISCINNMNANSLSIVFKYPVFLSKSKDETGSEYFVRYDCERTIKKTSLITYKKYFKVEIPVDMEKYLIPGISGNTLVQNKIKVEIEGFEPVFAEDIIEIADNTLSNLYVFQFEEEENLKLVLLSKIRGKIIEKFSCDDCKVQMISQKMLYSYTTSLSGKNIRKSEDKIYNEEYSIT